MTHNQIDYLALQETKRHQKAVEAETNRYNVVVATETNRHNIAVERAQEVANANQAALNAITAEHNRNMEAETTRHNKAMEQAQYRVIEETNRANLANEAIARQNADTNALNARTNALNAQTNVAATQADIKYKQIMASVAIQNADTEQYKANVDANYKLNQTQIAYMNSAINKANSKIAGYNAKTNRINVIWGNANNTVNVVNNSLKTLIGIGKGIARGFMTSK